ncbi:pentapeptide repeat-containing protein [uncultured Tenacibaculum sp.]|uniref:pentapeptide repeat-containing protein n=1 Tax=uncultured Tenacibaculum sp. TaxID=174713 RepID=UPI0026021E9A|nr:pentapeptide repeat-containing protein [uncultured Tenacibaculum sp.]
MDKKVKELELENKVLRARLEDHEKQNKNKSKRRAWIFKKGIGLFLGINLKQSIRNTLNEFSQNGKVSKDTLVDLSTNLIKRFTRIGVFTFLIAVIPAFILIAQTVLLSIQNGKIEKQNRLITEQNQKIKVQVFLEDSNRRNNLVMLMDNVLNKVGENLNKNNLGELDGALLARIRSLGQGFEPYKLINYEPMHLKNSDSLVLTDLYSPERGLLLSSLVNIGINENSMWSLLNETLFNKAYLKEAVFTDAYLRGVKLDEAYLSRASLKHSNLKYSHLKNANLTRANLYKADLTGADLTGADLTGASLRDAILKEAKLKDLKSIDSVEVERKDWLVYLRDSLCLKGSDVLAKSYKVVKDTVTNYRLKERAFLVVKKY